MFTGIPCKAVLYKKILCSIHKYIYKIISVPPLDLSLASEGGMVLANWKLEYSMCATKQDM